MNYDFALNTRYDKSAYEALAEASWQLFRKPRMQTQTYPILIALAALTLFVLIRGRVPYRRQGRHVPGRIPGRYPVQLRAGEHSFQSGGTGLHGQI